MNVELNEAYGEKFYEPLQGRLNTNENLMFSLRFGIVSEMLYEACQQLEADPSLQSDFLDYARELFVDCFVGREEYIIADIYAFCEVYSHECELPKRLVNLLDKYTVDYGKLGRNIEECEKYYEYSFEQLNKLMVISRHDAVKQLRILCMDMRHYVEDYDYQCKSNMMRRL